MLITEPNPCLKRRFISYICSLHKPDVVPVFKYLLLCISYSIYVVQYYWMDLSENKKASFDYAYTYGFFLVYTWHLVWLGLLCLHRLALGCKGKTWIDGPFQFLYTFSHPEIDWRRPKSKTCGDWYTDNFPFELCVEYLVKY